MHLRLFALLEYLLSYLWTVEISSNTNNVRRLVFASFFLFFSHRKESEMKSLRDSEHLSAEGYRCPNSYNVDKYYRYCPNVKCLHNFTELTSLVLTECQKDEENWRLMNL